ncbi:MAG: META domain-containing protein [Bifidobacteriaceae bacterium]|jgi:hypothetical protein|nr:META domain-containing protein [Bifidobacteriaceae bacterium]
MPLPTMPSRASLAPLALVLTLVLAASGCAGSAGGPGEPGAPDPGDGAAQVLDGLFAYSLPGADPDVPEPNSVMHAEFSEGQVRLVYPCVGGGTGRYTAGEAGAWTFDAGTLAQASCPGQSATRLLDITVAALEQATEWRQSADAAGIIFEWTGESARFDRAGVDPWGAGAGQPPAAPSGDPEALIGKWTVAELQAPEASGGVPAPPFGWTVELTGESVVLPDGCNTPGGGDYAADASGRWVFPVSGFKTEMACLDAQPMESEAVFDTLGAVRYWAQPAPGRIELWGAGTRLVLEGQTDGEPAAAGPLDGLARHSGTGDVAIPTVLELGLEDGEIQIRRGCLPAPRPAAFTASPDGAWDFDPGGLGEAVCPGEAATAQRDQMLGVLDRATEWEFDSPGGLLTISGGGAAAEFFWTAAADLPDPAGSRGSVSQPRSGFEGEWQVEKIERFTDQAAEPEAVEGPFAWTLTLADGKVTMPPGCNTPGEGHYAIGGQGSWAFAQLNVRTVMGCAEGSERNQSELVHDALGEAVHWDADGLDGLVLSGQSSRIHLRRPE